MRSAPEAAAMAILGGSLVLLFLHRKLLTTTRKLEFLSECVKEHEMGLEYLTQQLETLREGTESEDLSAGPSLQKNCPSQRLPGSSKPSPMLKSITRCAPAGTSPACAPSAISPLPITVAQAEQRLACERHRGGINRSNITGLSTAGSDGYRTAEEDVAWEPWPSKEDVTVRTAALERHQLTSAMQAQAAEHHELKLDWPSNKIDANEEATTANNTPVCAGADCKPSLRHGRGGRYEEEMAALDSGLLTTESSPAKRMTHSRRLVDNPTTGIQPSNLLLSPVSSREADTSNGRFGGTEPQPPFPSALDGTLPQFQCSSYSLTPLDRCRPDGLLESSSSSFSSYTTQEAVRAEGALRTHLLQQSDTLYVEGSYEAGLELLSEQLEQLGKQSDGIGESSLECELLWRLARLNKELSTQAQRQRADQQLSRQLLWRAFEYTTRALELDPSNFAAHKWYAISVSQTSAFDGTKAMIKKSFIVKKHLEEATRLNPRDATSRHLLGLWYFEVASLSWATRKVAAVMFTSPPSGSYMEALEHFLHAEQLEEGFYIKNRLMIAKAHIKLRELSSAREWLHKAMKLPAKTDEDDDSLAEVRRMLSTI